MRKKLAGELDPDGSHTLARSIGPRRRLYLLRHGEVAYFGPDGLPAEPWGVSLTAHMAGHRPPNSPPHFRAAGWSFR